MRTAARTTRLALLAALAALLLVAAPTALGGKGKPGSGSGASLNLVLLDSTDGIAHHGQRVSFAVSTTATDRPFVGVRCWQGTSWVYDAYVGFFPTYMFDPWVTLGSPYWNPAVSAACTARLFYYDKRGNQKVLTTLDFTAHP